MNLLISILLAVTLQVDSVMLEAYHREDMSVWKEYIDNLSTFHLSPFTLTYEYGYCGYIVAEAKKEGKEALLPEAKRCVENFKSEIINHQSQLPLGHYEMYMSAVYVYELRLHQSFHPAKAMSMAKEATQLAPSDPLVLAYYGTSLYYAPKPFGSKKEALRYFERAAELFQGKEWQYCWVREASNMYIQLINNK